MLPTKTPKIYHGALVTVNDEGDCILNLFEKHLDEYGEDTPLEELLPQAAFRVTICGNAMSHLMVSGMTDFWNFSDEEVDEVLAYAEAKEEPTSPDDLNA